MLRRCVRVFSGRPRAPKDNIARGHAGPPVAQEWRQGGAGRRTNALDQQVSAERAVRLTPKASHDLDEPREARWPPSIAHTVVTPLQVRPVSGTWAL